MKTWSSSLLVAFFAFVLSSCDQDDTIVLPQYAENAKLQRVLSYPYGSTEQGHIVEEYEYDAVGRLSRIIDPRMKDGLPFFYKEYEYNDAGQLAAIKHYEMKDGEYFNSITQSFEYNASGLKSKETVESHWIGAIKYFTFLYEGNLLVKMEDYNEEGKLQYYTVYDYNQAELLTQSTVFNDEDNYLASIENSYTGSLLIKSVHYSGTQKEVVKVEHRFYDNNDNLVLLRVKNIAPWLSSVSYDMRYEYTK